MDSRLSFLQSIAPGDVSELWDLITSTEVCIVVQADAIASYSGQVLIFQLATLTYRLFDQVSLIGDENVSCHQDFSVLSGSYLEALRCTLPELRERSDALTPTRSIRVVVGAAGEEGGEIYVGSSAWTASISKVRRQPVSQGQVSIGALGAGTLAAAEIFKEIFRGRIRGAAYLEEYSVSFLDYSRSSDQEPDLPSEIPLDVTLFGAGSIGCGFLQALVLTPQFHGQLAIVDNGCFDERNPFKYSFLDLATATKKDRKASWASQRVNSLTSGRIVSMPFFKTAYEYVADLPVDYRIPLAISAVDSPEARMEIQDTLPATIINAGIEATLVEVSVHCFGVDACLSCLQLQNQFESWDPYRISERVGLPPRRVRELIQGNLGMMDEDLSTIRTAGKVSAVDLGRLDSYLGQPLLSFWNRLAYSEAPIATVTGIAAQVTTAFASAYAGVLLLAELIKAKVPELGAYRLNNSYRQEMLGVPAESKFRYERDQKGWCLCHSSFRQLVYREKYGGHT